MQLSEQQSPSPPQKAPFGPHSGQGRPQAAAASETQAASQSVSQHEGFTSHTKKVQSVQKRPSAAPSSHSSCVQPTEVHVPPAQLPLQHSTPSVHIEPSAAHSPTQAPSSQMPEQHSSPSSHPRPSPKQSLHTPARHVPSSQQGSAGVQLSPIGTHSPLHEPLVQVPLQHSSPVPHADWSGVQVPPQKPCSHGASQQSSEVAQARPTGLQSPAPLPDEP